MQQTGQPVKASAYLEVVRHQTRGWTGGNLGRPGT